jgi:hypothetical protein
MTQHETHNTPPVATLRPKYLLNSFIPFLFQEPLVPYLDHARIFINKQCTGLEAWQVIFYTLGITLVLVWLRDFLFREESELLG